VHAKCSTNRAAHACAQFGASCAFDVWANDPSSFVRNRMLVSLEGEGVN
jgi:hypothetical protein